MSSGRQSALDEIAALKAAIKKGAKKPPKLESDMSISDWGFDKECCFRCGIHTSQICNLLMQCALCKKAYYCSVQCFNADLEAHQKICRTTELLKEPVRRTTPLPDFPKTTPVIENPKKKWNYEENKNKKKKDSPTIMKVVVSPPPPSPPTIPTPSVEKEVIIPLPPPPPSPPQTRDPSPLPTPVERSPSPVESPKSAVQEIVVAPPLVETLADLHDESDNHEPENESTPKDASIESELEKNQISVADDVEEDDPKDLHAQSRPSKTKAKDPGGPNFDFKPTDLKDLSLQSSTLLREVYWVVPMIVDGKEVRKRVKGNINGPFCDRITGEMLCDFSDHSRVPPTFSPIRKKNDDECSP